jgi:hypothetical protein
MEVAVLSVVVGHVTEGIEEEASKGRRRGVGGGVDACAWGTDGWRKEKDLSRGLSTYL